MKTAICLAAKLGDVVNFIAVAKHIAETENEPPTWIVHQLVEPVLRGVSYVKTVKIRHDIRRVDLTLRVAEAFKPDRIINPTTFGKRYAGPRDRAHNFLAWSQNGFGGNFFDLEKFPLTFDRRDAERESALAARYVSTEKPTLLICLRCARGAPFAHHRLVGDSITKRWQGRAKIVDLCDIRVPRFYDLLGILEKSALLICADTAPAHLCAAIPGMKVISLVPDSVFLGAEMRYTLVRRVRYGEALAQLPAIHADIASMLG